MKVKITDAGLLIPREVAERLGSDEVEVVEEPGRLVIIAGSSLSEHAGAQPVLELAEDPILRLGQNPVYAGVRDGSSGVDRTSVTP